MDQKNTLFLLKQLKNNCPFFNFAERIESFKSEYLAETAWFRLLVNESIQDSLQFPSLELGAYCESWLKQQLRQAQMITN